MVRVKYNDLDFALSLLEKESKPILQEYQSQLFFTPEKHRRNHKQMKKRADKRPGGRFNGRR